MTLDTKANEAVDEIIADLTDRKGLRHQWENIDEDIQTEIKERWSDIISKHTRAEQPRDLTDASEIYDEWFGGRMLPASHREIWLDRINNILGSRTVIHAPQDDLVKALEECRYKAELQVHRDDSAGLMQDIFMIVDTALTRYKKTKGE